MGCKTAVQVLKEADLLKAKLCKPSDLLNDTEPWTSQQQLQSIYHRVLVLDLEYALDKKVEQELWTLGFKNHISALQDLAKDKKNPKRQDSQALLSWCLEAASGFYITLLHELCTAFDLDLPSRPSGLGYGQSRPIASGSETEEIAVPPQSSSCLYICQYCLVHLGDIARYRNQRHQAEDFYKQAVLVSPNSGQPYNQLALLSTDKLTTVFHYVRAIAVKNPFPVSITNLSTTLSSAVDKDEPILEVQNKMSLNKLLRTFLYAHGLLNSGIDLHQAEIAVKSINATLTALVATQSFTSDKLIKMIVINIYALWKLLGTGKPTELTSDEIKAREMILDLIAGSLSAFLLPIYTLKNDESLLDYCALPAIKLICCWIRKQPQILNETVFTSRLQIWPGFCKLVNDVQVLLKDFNYKAFENAPLSEDKELRGFLPLDESFKSLNFKLDVKESNEKLIRARRLVDFGVWLTKNQPNKCLIISDEEENENSINFKPGCIQPDPTDQLLELMKSINVSEVTVESKKPKGEKRTGILKPQGSLERSREEREQNELQNQNSASNRSSENSKLKRVKQNVALQSIFKKIEENKQVKFSEETGGDEDDYEKPKVIKNVVLSGNPNTTSNATNALNQPYRTQTFNQNHPGLSSNLRQDFFNEPINKMHQFQPQLRPPHPSFAPPPMEQPPNIMRPPPMLPMYQGNFRRWTSQEGPTTSVPQHQQQHPQQHQQQLQQQHQQQQQQQANLPPPPPNNWWQNDFAREKFANVAPPLPPPQYYQQQSRVDYGQGMFGGWGGGGTRNVPPPPMGGFPSSQGVSMRQAMLNEAKHIGVPTNMQKPNEIQPPASAPGYSLFDTKWPPPTALTHLRTPDMMQNRTAPPQHHSLFSGPSHTPLLQLLEQQNQYQKPDK